MTQGTPGLTFACYFAKQKNIKDSPKEAFQSICHSISRLFQLLTISVKHEKNLQEPKALLIDRNFVNVQINYTCGF